MLPELSVVIVNYNGEKYLKNCLDSLYIHLNDIVFEIIVVDNDSRDNSIALLKSNFASVKIIESNVNLGFGKANNLGVDNANGKKILLLNNDTILLQDLKSALTVLDENQNIGALTINMLNAEKTYIPAVGKFPNTFNLIKLSLLNDKRPEFVTGKFDSSKLYEVDWATGAFLLLHKADYVAVGGFDPDYFMYVEDTDLCKKISLLHKKIVFLPALSYIHFVGFNKTRENLLIEGCKIYVSKHLTGVSKIIAMSMLVINKFVKRVKTGLKN